MTFNLVTQNLINAGALLFINCILYRQKWFGLLSVIGVFLYVVALSAMYAGVVSAQVMIITGDVAIVGVGIDIARVIFRRFRRRTGII